VDFEQKIGTASEAYKQTSAMGVADDFIPAEANSRCFVWLRGPGVIREQNQIHEATRNNMKSLFTIRS